MAFTIHSGTFYHNSGKPRKADGTRQEERFTSKENNTAGETILLLLYRTKREDAGKGI